MDRGHEIAPAGLPGLARRQESHRSVAAGAKKMKTTATKRAKVAPAKDFPVNISHPDKVFWPEDGYTKGDLAEFYISIFSKLGLRNRTELTALMVRGRI